MTRLFPRYLSAVLAVTSVLMMGATPGGCESVAPETPRQWVISWSAESTGKLTRWQILVIGSDGNPRNTGKPRHGSERSEGKRTSASGRILMWDDDRSAELIILGDTGSTSSCEMHSADKGTIDTDERRFPEPAHCVWFNPNQS